MWITIKKERLGAREMVDKKSFKEKLGEHKKEVISIFILLIILIGGSFAWLVLTVNGTKTNDLVAGTLSVILDESESNEISITNGEPLTDEEGLQTTAYTFTLRNNGTLNSKYTIYLDDVDLDSGETRLNNSFIKYDLVKNNVDKTPKLLTSMGTNPNRVLDSGTINAGNSNTYNLKIWLDYNATNDAQGKRFKGKLRVEATQNKTETANPNPPELLGDMIPVNYDTTSGNWVKADSSNEDNTWFNYDKQRWANAVTIGDTNKRATYVSAAVGTEISMDDINSMWVWIPRYSYTIGNTYGVQGYGGSTPSSTTPGAIDIKWANASTTETGTASYTGSTPSNYYTPNAFCWGDTCDTTRTDTTNDELTGIWVAKFETSGENKEYDNIQQPIVKPDVQSWRAGKVLTFFTAAQTYMNGDYGTNNYGFSGNYDAHMMKNTEWGAVAYLSQSKYGKYGNTDYSGTLKEIYKNDSSYYYTGRSEGTAPATSGSSANGTYIYSTVTGQGASTTGNITGIYDMSGGAWEYVMGNYNNESGMTSKAYTADEAKALGYTSGALGINNSGFTGTTGLDNLTWTGITFPSQKYYNLYTTTSSSNACNSSLCKSHGLGEAAGWYGDYATFTNSWYPWLIRGSRSGFSSIAGIFGFSATSGQADINWSFRLTLLSD